MSTRLVQHRFGTPNRFGIESCRRCKMKRRLVLAANRVTIALFQNWPVALWSDFNPGCVGSWYHPLRADIIDPTETKP